MSYTCPLSGQAFTISDAEKKFYQEFDLKLPTLHPVERERRRLAFRNERNLHKSKCQATGQEIITFFHPDDKFNVVSLDYWWSDQCDSIQHGRDFDFNRPFFEQYSELLKSCPLPALIQANTENCPYSNFETDIKNCYLTVGGHFNEDLYYTTFGIFSKTCADLYWVLRSELCYECVECHNCYQVLYSLLCENCHDTYFSFDCHGCEKVIACAGLRNKKYQVFNKPVSEQEFQKIENQIKQGSYKLIQVIKNKAQKFWQTIPRQNLQITNCQNCFGDFIKNSKNCSDSWESEKDENQEHTFISMSNKNGYNLTGVGWSELVHEVMAGANLYQSMFSWMVFDHNSYINYCSQCGQSEHLFGCVGLRRKKYCILNKQYSQEKYEKMVPQIIEHMRQTKEYGEFFPIKISPFAYNETVAFDYYPLPKEEVLRRGYRWRDQESKDYQPQTYQIPDSIQDVGDDICQQILACEVTGKNYRIIPQELKFYRQLGLPIPRRCPEQRHRDRLKLLPPRKLHQRQCDKCQKEIQSTYASHRPEIVYCEKCYLEEVY